MTAALLRTPVAGTDYASVAAAALAAERAGALVGSQTGQGGALMLMDDTRLFYRSRLGRFDRRCGGGWCVMVALERPLHLCCPDGHWQQAQMAVLPPYTEHAAQGHGGLVAQLLIEDDSVDAAALPAWMRQGSAATPCPPVIHAPALIASWVRQCRDLDDAFGTRPLAPCLDRQFFGAALPARRLDPRIERLVRAVAAAPSRPHSAAGNAQALELSTSRFLHLFSKELGVPYRRFRAWKRARGTLAPLALLSRGQSLTELALDSGYSDAAHFSNAIRSSFGITPRHMLAGTSRLLSFDPPLCGATLPQ